MNLLQTMEHYTVLPRNINQISGNNKMTDTLVFAYIKARRNFITDIADNVTEKEIASKLNIPIDTVENIIPRIKSNRLLFSKVEQDERINGKEYKTYNKYHLRKDDMNYFYFYYSLFNDDLGIEDAEQRNKIKGFLFQLKSVCLKETNKYICNKPRKGGINKSQLAKRLGIDTKTLNKYLEIAINAKQIKLIDNGLLIINKSIIPDFAKNDLYTKIYHIIYNWCIDNNIVPPDRNDEITVMADSTVRRRNTLLTGIAFKLGNMTDEDIRCLLTNRITSKDVTLEYIAAVLNIKKIKSEIQCLFIMD